MESTIKDYSSKLEFTSNAFQQHRDERERSDQLMKAEYNECQSLLQERELFISELQSQLINLQSELEKHEISKENLQNIINDRDSTVSLLKSEVELVQAAFSFQENTTNNLSIQVKELSANLFSSENSNRTVTDIVHQKNVAIVELNNEMEKLRSDFAQHEEIRIQMEIRMNESTSRLEFSVTALQQTLENRDREIATMKYELESIDQAYFKKDQETLHVVNQLESTAASLQTKEIDLENLEQVVINRDSLICLLKDELNEIREVLSQKNNKVLSLEEVIKESSRSLESSEITTINHLQAISNHEQKTLTLQSELESIRAAFIFKETEALSLEKLNNNSLTQLQSALSQVLSLESNQRKLIDEVESLTSQVSSLHEKLESTETNLTMVDKKLLIEQQENACSKESIIQYEEKLQHLKEEANSQITILEQQRKEFHSINKEQVEQINQLQKGIEDANEEIHKINTSASLNHQSFRQTEVERVSSI